MSSLQEKNLQKCISLLREFVEESPALAEKKGTAALALNQLQKITAGTGNDSAALDTVLGCYPRPRAG
ncbi:MAG: hypothetical protein KAW12_15045 [Candidatus Aminicenantes bacterium]|nr:hypothetical protein [Candidatus Aminicenantes bacterium]